MGVFTTVLHNGQELQFKHGWDNCDTYSVGDKIDWTPDPRYPGEHIDGVYKAHEDSQVVVKDCVIVAIEPADADLAEIVARYKIKKPSHKLWTKAQWKAKHKREAEHAAEYAAWAKINGDNPVGFYFRKRLSERSIVDQIFPARRVGTNILI